MINFAISIIGKFKVAFILEYAKLDNMKITSITQLREKASEASDLLKALSNPERLLILCHLVEGEQSAGELWQKSELSQSAFSST